MVKIQSWVPNFPFKAWAHYMVSIKKILILFLLVIGGPLLAVATGQVTAPYFEATSATSTSTFAGSIAAGTNGFVYDADTGRFAIATGTVAIGGSAPSNTTTNFILNGAMQFSPINIGPNFGPGIAGMAYRNTLEAFSDPSFVFRANAFIFENTIPQWILGMDGTNRRVFIGVSSNPTYVPQSTLEVSGNMTVGSGYAGVNVGPANGLAVQGYVGIGTTTPQTALQVSGQTILGNGDWPTVNVGKTNYRVGILSTTEDGVLVLGNRQADIGADRGGRIVLGARATIGIPNITKVDITGMKENAVSGDYSSYFNVAVRNAANTPIDALRINSSGNIGVGTINPSGLFAVQGDGTTGGKNVFTVGTSGTAGTIPAFGIAARSADPKQLYAAFNSGGGFSNAITYKGVEYLNPLSILETGGTFATASSSLLYVANIGSLGNKGNGSGSTLFRADFSDATAFIIDKNGNVGVGMANPTAKLDVNGMIRASQTSSTACASGTEGTFYYNSISKHFFGCNGTSWKQLDN